METGYFKLSLPPKKKLYHWLDFDEFWYRDRQLTDFYHHVIDRIEILNPRVNDETFIIVIIFSM